MAKRRLDLRFSHGTIGPSMLNMSTPSAPSDGPAVTIPYEEIREVARQLLARADLPEIAKDCAEACAFLEACGYPGLKLLLEALDTTSETERHPALTPDTLGLDLHGVSCVFLAPRVSALVGEHGRLFLRNVRHGLYLVPFSISANIGIGCPVDPAFALGGERTRNPYEEKLALARQNGITLDEATWQSALSRTHRS